MENKNTTGGNKPRRPGLIRQDPVVPTLPEPDKEKVETESQKENSVKQEVPAGKKANFNQQRNIKISIDTKKQIDILLKFSNHKFAYELIDSMIDVYVEHALDNDQKRAFKTLSKLISE